MDVSDLQVDPQVLLTELGDGTGVLLHLETKFYYQLNATAVVVWKGLAAQPAAPPRALAEALAERFEVEAERAETDVHAIVRELATEGLLVRRSEAAAPRGG